MIFRYNLEVPELEQFSIIHRYTPREEYKKQWEKWLIDNEELVRRESERLRALGYNGNVPEKMYKSVRYYYSTKTTREPKERREYLPRNTELIEQIDAFLKEEMKKDGFTPQKSFLAFGQDCKKLFKNRYYKLRPAFQKSVAF